MHIKLWFATLQVLNRQQVVRRSLWSLQMFKSMQMVKVMVIMHPWMLMVVYSNVARVNVSPALRGAAQVVIHSQVLSRGTAVVNVHDADMEMYFVSTSTTLAYHIDNFDMSRQGCSLDIPWSIAL
jgi:hypothetical protein